MSFILDALKKSESDRQRQSGPSLFEVKVAPPRRALPVWAVAIAVLLGINVIVISWMLLRRPAGPQPAVASPRPTAAAVHEAPAARAPVAPPVQGPAASGPPPGAAAAAAGASTPPPAHAAGSGQASAPAPAASGTGHDGDQQSAGDNPSDNAPAVEPAVTPGSATSGGFPTGEMPLYQQIVTSDNLPALHLDLHVFAARPRDRFVMINMHRLGEGDSLPSGVHVDAIRPDGAVLSYQGTRFLLPRN
ncbi:MAG TPA: general secretion pathway protein GspB [Steroidobacteraceae bacterium]|jgi:general secretion pathway protein B|nr:general secretion pathway protein GspB [Steroidobacteraceae bacterium]